MIYVCLIIATILLAVYVFLIVTVPEGTGKQMLMCLYKHYVDTIKDYQLELNMIRQKIKAVQETISTMQHEPDPRLLKRQKVLLKKMDETKKILDNYKKNGLGILDMIPLTGYRVMDILGIDNNNEFLARLRKKCLHIKYEQDAMAYATYLMANLLGNLMLSAVLLFWGIGFGLAMGMGTRSLVIGIAAAAVFALLGYLPYDGINSILQKRADSIERDFPRVVSKLALLTISGLELNQAWELVSASETGTVYQEMRRVIIDMNNNVPYVTAYTGFINRCDYGYTTKLATAIMQNMSKGNAEIVSLLHQMNTECWSEYKHAARRKGEMISTKLTIPTLLLFAGMLILVLVPTIGGFNLF
ncbi:MAG: type II secretion system F family protein [Clostridia bacterium]|nr:type II secretion system F family protein [Clostridia bacterium]